MVGLAPSASAAQVLGDELGIDTENTAKWLHEHRQQRARQAELDELRDRHSSSTAPFPALEAHIARLEADLDRWSFHQGQLVIVDEASLAGTFALDELAEVANLAGAKVLLAGDTHQLGAVDAGGAFRLLVRDRDDIAPELTDVRRFKAEWEKIASVELRVGNTDALEAYEEHGRIVAGARGELLDRLYQAWRDDIEAGKSSLMVAADADTVSELNRRARGTRVAAGLAAEQGLTVADGQTAGVGDEVVTRLNKRTLSTAKGYVKNGDRWTVTATNKDGSMLVRRAGGGGSIVLPADYVRDNVELGYAVTAYQAQGRTLDTAHAMVTATTTREVLYVEATRGREANHLYVDTHHNPDPDTSHDGMVEAQTGRQVLEAALATRVRSAPLARPSGSRGQRRVNLHPCSRVPDPEARGPEGTMGQPHPVVRPDLRSDRKSPPVRRPTARYYTVSPKPRPAASTRSRSSPKSSPAAPQKTLRTRRASCTPGSTGS